MTTDVDRLRRRAERERSGRLQAEQIMESKYRELYQANQMLTELAHEVAVREEYSRAIFLAAYDGLISVDSTGCVDQANPAALALLDYSDETIRGIGTDRLLDLHANGFAHPLTSDLVLSALQAGMHGETDMDARRSDGSTFPASVTVGATTLLDSARYILVVRDLTDGIAATAALSRMAFIDPLTDLGNRYWLRRQFDDIARDGDRELCLFSVNLDWFKRINDSLGHKVGDDALAAVARRIVEPVSAASGAYRYFPCRMGGDEFAVLVARNGPGVDWMAVAEGLRARICAPMALGGSEVTIGASVGFSHAQVVVADFDRLVNEADIAMRRAKRDGNHQAQAYESSMGYRASGTIALEEGIRLGLARGEFAAYFQPKVDVVTGAIVGAEALVRWEHPAGGVLLPASFLITAEGSDLITFIGEVVLADVLRFQQRSVELGLARPIAVNISSREFGSPVLARQLDGAVREAGISPSLISVEITEGVVAAEEDQHHLLRSLHDAGFPIAIDDFGVAQSSLSRLRTLTLDELKIDRSFIEGVPQSEIDGNILRAMVSLGSATGARVVVEGVERQDQLDFLRSLGPCIAQGFYFSRPVCAEDYLTMLVTEPWLR